MMPEQDLSPSSNSPTDTHPVNWIRGNKAYGRLQTFELACEMPPPDPLPEEPPEMLTRRAGRCEEPLEEVRKRLKERSLFDKFISSLKNNGRFFPEEEGPARGFRRMCEQLPDQIPGSLLRDGQQLLNDFLSGQAHLDPEDALSLRGSVRLMQDVYNPPEGPSHNNPDAGYSAYFFSSTDPNLTDAERAWLRNEHLRFPNSIAISLDPGAFVMGGLARLLGRSEEEVADAVEVGMNVTKLPRSRYRRDIQQEPPVTTEVRPLRSSGVAIQAPPPNTPKPARTRQTQPQEQPPRAENERAGNQDRKDSNRDAARARQAEQDQRSRNKRERNYRRRGRR